GEVPLAEDRAGVVIRVAFEAEPFLEPLLQVRVVRLDAASHDADRGRPVKLLHPVDDRPEERLPLLVPAHVVDGEDDNRVDTRLADPLGGDEFGEGAMGVPGVKFVEVSELVAVAGGGGAGEGRGGGGGVANGGIW